MRYSLIIIAACIFSFYRLSGQDKLEHIPKLFVDSTGQVYTKTDAPAYILIAPADNEDKLMLVPSTDKGANPMYWDGAGSHYIMHRDIERNMNIRFRILADGQAPKTKLTIENGLIFHLNNIFFVESGAAIAAIANDDMSGVYETFVSVNNEGFQPIGNAPKFTKEGEFLVHIYSVDNVGNIETPKEYIVNTTTEPAVRMENIYFDTNSAKLKPESINELNKLATILKQFPYIHLEIRAHTDSWGDPKNNLLLSERRAQAAVAFLNSKGISQSRLTANGFGETMLVNECAKGVKCPSSKHLENRRIELVVSKIELD